MQQNQRPNAAAPDTLDDLASDVDDALVSADELKEEVGNQAVEQIDRVKESLEHAKETIDEMEDAHD
jgi:hypothetical protein